MSQLCLLSFSLSLYPHTHTKPHTYIHYIYMYIYRESQSIFNLLIWQWFITETRNSMSAGVNLYLIGNLYECSWRFFFNIFLDDTHERPSSLERRRRDFGLLPTESFTAYTLFEHLAVHCLPDFGFFAFLLRLFTDPIAWYLCTQR